MQYADLRPHFDAVYDLLLSGRLPRDATPLLDVGTGDGGTLAAVVSGTPMGGVAVDTRIAAEWRGPDKFAFVQADAHRLSFRNGAFASGLTIDTLEWLADPSVALREMARVVHGPLVIVHTDWHSLWFDSADPDTGREFTRLFAGPPAQRIGGRIEQFVQAAGLRAQHHDVQTIHSDRLDPQNYALHVLRLMRQWLVIQTAGVRASRFDTWRSDLDARAQTGEFSYSVGREVVVVEASEEPLRA